jgi:large subunit ribosomal protein L25
MANEFKLELDKRDGLGSKAVKSLRNEGKIPGVFYSADTDATPFIIDMRHLHDALQSQSHVYAVSVGGKKLHAILKEIQYHPVSDEIIHLDLFGVSLTDKITISVPIILSGESIGVNEGGIMSQSLMELEIQCLATEVPDAVHVDVTELEMNEARHVNDLEFADGIEVLTPEDMTVVSVTAPKEEALEPDIPVEEDLELEGEEGEEGEVAEGEETPAEGEEGAEESTGDKKEEGTSE